MRSVWLVVVCVALGCGSERRPIGSGDGGSGDGGTRDGAPSDAQFRDVVLPDVPGEVCESVSAIAEPLPPTLLFQLDMSNSMNCPITQPGCLTEDPTTDPNDSRWDVFRSVFLDALGRLPAGTRIGLMRFPASDRACAEDVSTVAIDALATNRSAVESAVSALVPNGIGTPTHDAVLFGLGRLRADMGERPFLVLATDGDARACVGCDNGCSFDALDDDNDDMVDEVGAAATAGIPSFVIGVPGAQGFRDVLSRMASAAGTAREGCSDTGPNYCHFDLTEPGLDFATALGDALAAIGEAVISCEYDIPENPDGAFDETRVNVRVTTESGAEEVLPRDTSRTNGWDYDDARERVILHGEACTRAQAAMRVDVLFGCPTILI